jgi:hypothetical protein
LVGVFGRHALVVTNWHVVRDAPENVAVIFPSGFRSAARVLKVDPEWDLAALLIWRPNTTPIPISTAAPRPGDVLTIAGYGSGQYRAVSGRCTQYVAPGMNSPFEMVEVSAQARSGDSGGPMLNERGELAGVLFGASRGATSGSYCGRVREFLASVVAAANSCPETHVDNQQIASPSATLDQVPRSDPSMTDAWAALPDAGGDAAVEATAPRLGTPRFGPSDALARRSVPSTLDDSPPMAATSAPNRHRPPWRDFAGDSPFQQAKTLLASIGLLAVLLRLSRWMPKKNQ